MTSDLMLNPHESDDSKRLVENYHYLQDHRCLKRLTHTPLSLRRSFSLEDKSIDIDHHHLSDKKDKLSSTLLHAQSSHMSSSLNSLCLKIRRYQLLPEYDENIAKTCHENVFNWRKTSEHLRSVFQNIIMDECENKTYSPGEYKNNEITGFQTCKRQQRRNAVCIEVDRLCYNDQLILFAMTANEVQLEFNLAYSGFKK